MRLRLEMRDLLLASWPAERKAVERALPPDLEPAEVGGAHLVTAVCLRCSGGRLAGFPVPPFSQLNLRTYVLWQGEPAVFFLRSNVTLAGMGGALFGAPYRPARLRFRPGRADAPGLGVSLRYELGAETADAGLLGRHELGIYEAAGLRAFRVHRGPASWLRGEPAEGWRADALLALGFDTSPAPALLYASSASFETDVPPRPLRAESSLARRSAR